MTTTFKFGIKPKLAIVLAPPPMTSGRGDDDQMFLQQAPAIKGPRS